jgi:hypothetical protein
MFRGDMDHHQDILFLQDKSDLIHTETLKAILFHLEAAWKEDQVFHRAHLREAADLHHHLAVDRQVLLPQDLLRQVLLRQVLLQAVVVLALHQVVVVHQEGDSLKQ